MLQWGQFHESTQPLRGMTMMKQADSLEYGSCVNKSLQQARL